MNWVPSAAFPVSISILMAILRLTASCSIAICQLKLRDHLRTGGTYHEDVELVETSNGATNRVPHREEETTR
jgi:hypothetical protein